MTGHRIAALIGPIFVAALAHAQVTPVSLTVHGPSQVYESGSADYAAVLTFSDGTKSRVSTLWSSSNATLAPLATAGIVPVGRLLPGAVSGSQTVTLSANYLPASLSATKTITILDSSAYPSVGHALVQGWNLLGNSIAAPLSVAALFGDQAQPVAGLSNAIVSVWKWDAVNKKWAFFSPTMTPNQIATYAASKNFAVLRVVHPGEGYWVNAGLPVTLPPRVAAPVSISSSGVVNGWNLIATGSSQTPSAFNSLMAEVPPAPGTMAQSFLSLWSWDAATGKWLFYAPNLEASGGLPAVKAYADAHEHLDFPTVGRQLGHGIGFWVNSPTVNPGSNLAPIGQAKGMFSELRTTVRAYSNDLRDGFLDAQQTRMHTDMQNKVGPDFKKVQQAFQGRVRAMSLFQDIWKDNTASYTTSINATAGTVSAIRMWTDGSDNIRCFSNDMAGTVVTKSLLTDVTCRRLNTGISAYVYSPSFTSRTQVIPFVKISPDTGQAAVSSLATPPDAYGYKWETWKATRTETSTSGFFNTFTFATSAPITPLFAGTFSRTYLPGTTNLSAFSIAGDINSSDASFHHSTLTVTGTRTLQSAANSVYRNSISGSVTSKDATGNSMVTLALASGSYYDTKEDASGNPLPNSPQALHFVGKAETSGSRFTGTIDLNAFATDADDAEWIPTSVVFNGTMEDLSSGGAGVYLNGTLTLTLNNLAAYHSLQPESSGNFQSADLAFVGSIQGSNRPEMRLTFGTSRTGLNTYSVNTTYTYGVISVTGSGTLDKGNSESVLTLTNQDGVTVSFHPRADAVVSKGGTTLGTIPLGSSIVYFTDGYFESL